MRTPTVVHTADELAELRSHLTARGRTLAFVPTMGALHEGHLTLVKRARELADVVIVSIFVNPLQFGPNEDFDRYPRTLDADVVALGSLADYVFAPAVEDIYPDRSGGPAVPQYTAGEVGNTFEGASRPGHFDGVLTVVARLFDLVKPDVAVFGQKDAQQVFLVRQLIAQEQLPLILEIVPTVREVDGLARSSRNAYLSVEERAAAVVMPHSLLAVAHMAQHGDVASARQAGIDVFASTPLAKLDYLEIVDPHTFHPVSPTHSGPATVVVAARVGTTRLIDTENIERFHA